MAPPIPSNPKGPSAPVSFPIDDLDYLASRSYFDSFHYPFNVASVPLPAYAIPQPSRRRLLACHDMQGGYQDDRWVQGGSNPLSYTLWHWYLIDTFVYFSHHMVTLPPPCWTNAAHRHGVKVLGTFILEWDEGRQKAGRVFSTRESAQMYAERLTELATALHFDGWLINMETKLSPVQIPVLKEFVYHLTQQMHASVPGSLVIWYDSVTISGDLQWQDRLNEKNKPFFDLCDGIFINYSWKEDYPRTSANAARDRRFDVYMGIDVFGRQCFHGGQWNVNAALEVLKKNNISAAIFGFGWVYENLCRSNFETNQNSWWDIVEKSWKILRPCPKLMPFYANFNQGQGYHFFIEGLQVNKNPWNNISCQQVQPFYDNVNGLDGKTMATFIDRNGESYNGGGNLTFRGNLEDETFFTRIFSAELILEGPIKISFSVRSNGNSMMGLRFIFSKTGGETSTLVADKNNLPLTNKCDEVVSASRSASNVEGEGWVVFETDVQKSGCTLTEISAVCYLMKLHKNEQDGLQLHGRKASKEDTAHANMFNASLGHLTIRHSNQNLDFPPANAWIINFENVRWSLSSGGSKTLDAKIIWKLKTEHDSPFGSYNIYVEKSPNNRVEDEIDSDGIVREFIGVATLQIYFVSNLKFQSGTRILRFTIQACAHDGTCQKIDESPTQGLDVAI